MAKLTDAARVTVSKGRHGSRTPHLKEVRSIRPAGTVNAADSLNALLHHRIRLGILSALAGIDSASFNELKALLKLTDGNLSVHARKLEDARYVECRKSFEARRPHTDYRLTADGRKALQRYLNHMEALIQATRVTLER